MNKRPTQHNSKTWINKILLVVLACLCAVSCLFVISSQASAAIYVGDSAIEGYQPNDIVSTDLQTNMSASEASSNLENLLVKTIKVIMPFLMIACVGVIVYNAAANIFRPKEKRVAMGALLKNMLVQYFFILFAFIIVEGIVFIVSGGETILFSTLLS